MLNQTITLQKLLKQLNRPLHVFLINLLIEAHQIAPPSCKDSVAQWLNNQPFLKMSKVSEINDRKEEDEECIYSLSSRILSPSVAALFHLYKVAQPSYQPKVPRLSWLLLSENKEEN